VALYEAITLPVIARDELASADRHTADAAVLAVVAEEVETVNAELIYPDISFEKNK
jgi:hypothetical protein